MRYNRQPQFSFLLSIMFTMGIGWSGGELHAQAPFSVMLEPIDIPMLGGLQSYAVCQDEGEWLVIGGRLDGLHRRQPWATFDPDGRNDQLIVINPTQRIKWSVPLTTLPAGLQEQLRSTNMEFHQVGDYLYVVGGYGYSDLHDDHITYPNLTAVDVPGAIQAIKNDTDLNPYFRQFTHDTFAVTGGQLKKIYDVYHLVGGQNFIGRYNPMGPGHGPGFFQEYTDEIRRFKIHDNGQILSVEMLPTIRDTNELHRRDYNVVHQIMPNGEEGITAFSGVFQKIADVPYLNCVSIDSTGYNVNAHFQQYYNHYHCATIPLYDGVKNEMHTLFFGGIAQYYEEGGTLIQDDEVPFVRTIARVTRDAYGVMKEYKLPVEMPDYLGASAEFIPVESNLFLDNEVINFSNLIEDTTHIGYIYGGIQSSAKNIFWINDGTQSNATNTIFNVYIIKNDLSGSHLFNEQSNADLTMQLFPHPADGSLTLAFYLGSKSDVELIIHDMGGKEVMREIMAKDSVVVGKNVRHFNRSPIVYGSVFIVTLRTTTDRVTQKLIVND